MTRDVAKDYLDHLAVQGRSANTLAAYRRDLARYAEFLQRHDVAHPSQAAPDLLAGFPAWLRDEAGYSERSAARIVAAVRGLHRWLDPDGGLGPLAGVKVTEPRPPAKILDQDAMRQFIEVEGVGDGAVRDRALFEVLYATGARTSEVVALTVEAVRMADGVVALPGEKGREAPLGRPAIAALQAWIGGARRRLAGPHRALLTNMAGERLTRQGVWQIVANRGAEVGLEVNPGIIRSSSRQHLVDRGMAPGLVRQLFRSQAVLDTELRSAWDAAHPRGGRPRQNGSS